jgi:type I restriction enzyme, R subunit
MSPIHTESTFETALEHSLLTAGSYTKGDPGQFDAAVALTPAITVAFLKASQPKEWRKLEAIHGSAVETKIIALLAKELDGRGTLDVLRHGVTDHGVKLRLAFFKPASGLIRRRLPSMTRIPSRSPGRSTTAPMTLHSPST